MNPVNLSALAAATLLLSACDNGAPTAGARSETAGPSLQVAAPPSTPAMTQTPDARAPTAGERLEHPRAERTGVPLTPTEVEQLIVKEPDASADQYRARTATLRLYGIQSGDEVPYATVADTTTWATRDLRVGDRLARNLRVVDIGDETITLRGAGGTQRLRIGEDVSVRLVHHIVDEAAVYRGKHRFDADLDAMRLVRDRYGVGAEATYASMLEQDGVALSNVDPEGLVSKLGLKDGDLVARINGEQVTEANFSRIAETLTTPGTQSIAIVQAHNVLELKVEVR